MNHEIKRYGTPHITCWRHNWQPVNGNVVSEMNPRYLAGSASLECIIIIGLIAPVAFGTVFLGKLFDLKHTTEQASRYSAWQSTVSSRDELDGIKSENISQRFFRSPSAPITSSGSNSGSSADSDNLPPPLWASINPNLSGSVSRLSQIAIETEDPVAIRFEKDISAASVATGLSNQVRNLNNIYSSVSAGGWTIHGSGMVKASVDVGLQSHDWFKGSNKACTSTESGACIQSSATILSDGWSASSDAQAIQRIRTYMPTSSMQSVGNAAAKIGKFFMFPELRGLKNAFGHVDMTVLPASATRRPNQ